MNYEWNDGKKACMILYQFSKMYLWKNKRLYMLMLVKDMLEMGLKI